MRRGLVLGAGGVLGAAWTVGALAAMEDELGFDARDVDVLVGTSAGSLLATALSCGVSVPDLLAHQRGEGTDTRLEVQPLRDGGGRLPPLPLPFVGSPRGVLHTALHPWSKTPMSAFAAWLPRGRGDADVVGRLVDGMLPQGGWTSHPATWIVACEHDTGRRVAFGRDAVPACEQREAVLASCAIPGWYPPVTINGRDHVDGGVCSPTSVDLVADLELDEVVVLSPMTSMSYDVPATMAGRLERRFRRLVTRRTLAEVRLVAGRGTRVHFLGPGAEDLEAIGANLMDPRRRLQVLDTSLRTSSEALRAGARAGAEGAA